VTIAERSAKARDVEMLKLFVKRTLNALKRTVSALTHHLPDFSLASLDLPWPLKEKLARIDMGLRSLDDFWPRTSFLQDARFIEGYSVPVESQIGPIWQYWHSGDQCPSIIQTCMASVQRHAGGRKIVFLSDDNLDNYVNLPDHIMAKRAQIGKTHFSDILRVHLLAQHGGTWIDASVFLTGEISHFTENRPFFVFTWQRPYIISSWFMHSVAGYPFACILRDLLSKYWVSHDELRAYFILHYFFECVLTLHADLRPLWTIMPTLLADAPHRLQNALIEGANDAELRDICRRFPLHKLSWKFPEPILRQAERITAEAG
jgi:Capsular polysaccharide synthesis protein